LGQITRLLYGRDRGWRGAVTGSAIVSGQPDKLQVKLDAQLRDFRRYDIATSDSMDVEAHCNGEYNFSSKQLRDIGCQMPAGSGVVLVNGHYGFQPSDDAELSISAESVPVQRLWQLARHAKRDLPSDTTATGVLTAIFTRRGQQHPVWTGDAQTSAIELRSTVLSKPLRIEATRWSLMSPGDESATKPKKKSGRKSEVPDLTLPAPPVPSRIALRLQPVSIGLDGTQAATLAGWFSAESYYSELQGEAELPRVFEVAKLAGLPEPASTIEGLAKGQVRVSGEWAGFGPATISGAAQLRNISARVSGVSKPLKISAGVFKSDKDSFEIRNAALRIDGVHTDFEVSASWPQHCATSDSAPCAIQFSVTADQLNTDEINTLLNPKAQKQPWYATLASSVMGSERKKFPEIFAGGDIAANSLVVKSTTLSPFKCSAEVHPKGFRLSNIAAGLFGGKYSGEVIADLTQDDPRYSWTGTLDSVAMANVAAAMKDGWATGTLTSHLEGQAAGWNAEAILASLSGVAEFDWTNGSLPHVEIDGSGKPLQFKHFSGIVKLTDGLLTVSEGKLQSAKSIYHVSGTASLQKQLKLKLARDGVPELSISGPLEHPTVSSSKVAETQAQLRQSR
jgi:AsmA-like C-terminal region